MKKISLVLLLAIIFVAFTPADVRKVYRVIDGDTIVVDKDERVRYIGIDTPEMRPVEPYAKEATAAPIKSWWTANR